MTLFTRQEKENFKNWEYKVQDNSITTFYFTPIFNYFLNKIPVNIAPNVLTFLGMICTFYGYFLTFNYFDLFPRTISFCLILLWWGYIIFDAIDGKQARKIGNSSPLGEFLDHACDILSDMAVILSFCYVIGIKDKWTIWYLVQVGELLFLEFHIRALRDHVVKFDSFYGPVEALCVAMGFCLLRILIPLNLNGFFVIIAPYLYYIVLAYLVYLSTTIPNIKTRVSLVSCLMVTILPMLVNIYCQKSPNMINIIGNGCTIAVITCDIILIKMGGSESHGYLLDLILVSVFDSFLGIMIAVIYYMGVLNELSMYLQMPLLSIKKKDKNEN